MNQPAHYTLVDVIIPVYNCGGTLPNTVESILSANLPDCTIFLIDDGSTEETAEICQSLMAQYPNIRYHRQENSGVSAARNTGISLSRAEYLLFVDGDDCILPFSDSLVQTLRNRTADMVLFGMIFQHCKNREILHQEVFCMEDSQLLSREDVATHWDSLFYRNYLSSACNKFIRRTLLTEHNLQFDPRLTNYEDLAFTLQALCHCRRIMICPTAHYLYRVDYDRDHTIDRIAKIQDIFGNTDLISGKFMEFEQSVHSPTVPIHALRITMLNLYLDIFRTKMMTARFSQIQGYCRAFQRNSFLQENRQYFASLSKGNRRLHRLIYGKNVIGIWLYIKYIQIRHNAARRIKPILRRLLP